MIISDPKGQLYKRYANYLKNHGYKKVMRLNFIHPEDGSHYNPLAHCMDTNDYKALAHTLTYLDGRYSTDPFWDESTENYFSFVIGMIMESDYLTETEKNMCTLLTTLNEIGVNRSGEALMFEGMSRRLVEEMERKSLRKGRDSWAYRNYKKFKSIADKTMKTVIMEAQAKLGCMDTDELQQMVASDDFNMKEFAEEKCAVFISISDIDRSKDLLANLFFTQTMQELCRYADEECEDGKLPMDVHYILDDFGTNCKIDGFENMISNIRARNISATIVLQSFAQLTQGYKEGASTIIANCDTAFYMGGNDLETARMFAERCNAPVPKVINMPIKHHYMIRRGETPKMYDTRDLSDYLEEKNINLTEYRTY